MRQHKTHRADDVRGNTEQHFALMQGFTHKAELVGFQITQTAMNHFGAGR